MSRVFRYYATPKLYSWIRIRHIELVNRFFQALAPCPWNCRHLLKLEVRCWPFYQDSSDLEDNVVLTLDAATHLRSLAFTRKDSLSDKLMEAINRLPRLQEFEINASVRGWNASQLQSLPLSLDSLSFLLPDKISIAILPSTVERLVNLNHITLLCLQSSAVTNDLLFALAKTSNIPELQSLSLSGCPKLTDAALLSFFRATQNLQHLALENCGQSTSFFATAATALRNLRSLKTTHPGLRAAQVDRLYPAIVRLATQATQLDTFTISATGHVVLQGGKKEFPVLEWQFILPMVQLCNFKRFEVNGLLMGFETVDALCAGAPNLQDLVLHVFQPDLDRLSAALHQLRNLRTLHLLSQRSISEDEVLAMVGGCARTLRQVGVRNRVWNVVRPVRDGKAPLPGHDHVEVKTALTPYDGYAWPEALLILR